MKKAFCLFFVITFLFALTACKEKNNETRLKICLVTIDETDIYWSDMNSGCKKAVKELGNIDFQWIAPIEKNTEKQIEKIKKAISEGARAILLAAISPTEIIDVLKEAETAGVKIIYVDSPADYDAVQTIATDNKKAGNAAGGQMLKTLLDKGVVEGKIGIISSDQSTKSTSDRETGFRSAMIEKGYTLIETKYSKGDAIEAENIADEMIFDGCVGIFATNESSAIGTGEAIKKSNKGVVGVGFDKSDMVLNMLKEGGLICTISQNPERMGYEGIKTAVKALNGETISEKNIDTGFNIITKDSVVT